MCEKCAKSVNDCHLKACIGALDQKNDITGRIIAPSETENQLPFTFSTRYTQRTREDPTDFFNRFANQTAYYMTGQKLVSFLEVTSRALSGA